MSGEESFTICLVGAGNMGGAMLSGWLREGIEGGRISVVDPSPPPVMAKLIADNSVGHFASADDAKPTDIVVLAVKPQILDVVVGGISPLIGENTVVVSVAAGKTIASICAGTGEIACIRAMPNTPALIGRGITVGYANGLVSEIQRSQVDRLLRATGSVAWVDEERLIDAVTAVSGSGPAYAFYLAECMAAAGVAAGLSEELALQLARETVAGAGELMMQSDDEPAQLRKNVTSPNGTTAAALDVLMADDGLGPLMLKAIGAAKKRSEELSL
ncbi:MAG: pyrroline-5-carboxylate reductase [Hyphomicrobiales bacterium]|nr:MAG: pyrroline-5-carboxylate reductase [Hyphomicrobiales bacterium]